MPGTYSGYAGGPALGDTSPYPSAGLWHQVDADLNRLGRWMHQWTDFCDVVYTETLPTTVDPYLGLRVFTDTGGTFSEVDVEGGVRRLSSDGDNEGASVARGIHPFKIIQNAGHLIFEARIRTSTITNTKHSIFVGLLEDVAMTNAIPITQDGDVLADQNLVGFHRLETDGDTLDTVYTANGITAVTVKADAYTLVADAWTKLAMVFNRTGSNLLEFYVNGVMLPDTKAIPSAAGTDFPNDVRLGWVAAVQNATGTTPGQTDLDWVRVAQRRVLSATNP